MAEQQEQQQQPTATNTLSSAFPAPPPFWKHFTPENLARLKEIQEQAGVSDGKPVNDVPSELQYLVPPTPPTTGTYRSFGATYDVFTSFHIYLIDFSFELDVQLLISM